MAERASGGKMSPLDPYHVTVMRAGYAAGIVANGPQDWFGPLDPQPPSAPPEVAGRALDFPAGFNLNIEPRAYESIKFADLRSLADSYDLLRLVNGSTYGLIGRFMGKSRMGTLTAPLPAVAPAPTGQTIDTADTLAVDISETGLTLNSGTQQDAVSGNTLCYVDGEYIAYQTATLTAVGKYSLTYLVRGLFGTTPAPHAAGAPFARIDGQVFRIPFTQDRIGHLLGRRLFPARGQSPGL